jgi:hypothetical protein
MNRRSFLQLMAAAGAALIADPKVLLERPVVPGAAAKAFDPTSLMNGVQKFLITFNEGGQIFSYEFAGYVTQMTDKDPIDGMCSTDLSIRPTGEFKEVGVRCPAPRAPERPRKKAPSFEAPRPTTLELNGEVVADLQEIQLPQMERNTFEVTRNGMFGGPADDHEVMIPGIRRMGEITMTVNWMGDPK